LFFIIFILSIATRHKYPYAIGNYTIFWLKVQNSCSNQLLGVKIWKSFIIAHLKHKSNHYSEFQVCTYGRFWEVAISRSVFEFYIYIYRFSHHWNMRAFTIFLNIRRSKNVWVDKYPQYPPLNVPLQVNVQ